MAYYSFSEAFLPSSMHACARYRQQRVGNITYASVKRKPNKNNKHDAHKKNFPLNFLCHCFQESRMFVKFIERDKKFLLRNRSILPSRKLCFLDKTVLSSTSGHAISSEQRNNYKSTCSLPSLWLISVATALVFGLSRH